MKTIVKGLFITLAAAIIYQCEKDYEFKITDENFLNALIERGVDLNGDSIISLDEAEIVTYLDISNENISDLTGIEAFVNLDTLICMFNKLTHLDVSHNTALKLFSCRMSHLTSLNVSNNKVLIGFDCSENELKSLNVSNDIALKDLICSGNYLIRLDVSSNTALIHFSCSWNYLTKLDVSNNTALTHLGCSHNQLTNLNISSNPSLTSLECGENQLTSLDISNNSSLELIGIEEMPSLKKVCVWEVPFPPAGVTLSMNNSPNVYFTTDCSK